MIKSKRDSSFKNLIISTKKQFIQCDYFFSDSWMAVSTNPVTNLETYTINNSLLANLNKLEIYSRFKKDWNGYGADPFSKKLIEEAKKFVLSLKVQPEVFPVADDSIQFEFRTPLSYLEIQLYENDKAHVFLIDEFGREKEYDTSSSIDNLKNTVYSFYE